MPEQMKNGYDRPPERTRPNLPERLLLKATVGLFLVIAVGWGLSILGRWLS